MIQLSEEQARALHEGGEQPPRAVDPRTGATFVLIKEDVYQVFRGVLASYNRGWDDPALDIYDGLYLDHR
jgi:hypothetical protein